MCRHLHDHLNCFQAGHRCDDLVRRDRPRPNGRGTDHLHALGRRAYLTRTLPPGETENRRLAAGAPGTPTSLTKTVAVGSACEKAMWFSLLGAFATRITRSCRLMASPASTRLIYLGDVENAVLPNSS